MRDFTLKTYKKLLTEISQAGYRVIPFKGYLESPDKKKKLIILRHDVDKKPWRSLRTAELENELGIKGTYYFRVIGDRLPRDVIERISGLGHEIGYHYEDLDTAGGLVAKALESFRANLAKLREIAPVATACMHGSPLSIYDNRDLWKKYDYRELGIIGEPYFDIDFNEVFYLTDTGRRWDGDKVSIRDKVRGKGLWVVGKREDRRLKTEDREKNKQSSGGVVCDPPALRFHSTMDIILAVKENRLSEKIMLTIHPQRWTGNYFSWMKELIWQKIKNVIKYLKLKRMEKNRQK